MLTQLSYSMTERQCSKNNKLTNISFSKSDFSLSNMQTNTTTYIKTQEISSMKIIKCLNNFYKFKKDKFELESKSIENCSLQNIKNILKEFYKRFIIPFYIQFYFNSFILIISSKENSNYSQIRITTFTVGFLIIILSETTIRFISNSLVENLIISSIPLILILVFIYFYFISLTLNIKNHESLY